MLRDEVLDLLLLEADGGLSTEEASRLREALAQDPSLKNERLQMQAAWHGLKAECRTIALHPEFGETRLASLRLPRREGVIIGGHVRAAAAALLLATFLRGGFDPRASVVTFRPVEGGGTTGHLAVPAGALLSALPGQPLQAAAADGAQVDVRDGAVACDANGAVRVEPGPVDATIRVGELPVRIDLGDVVLVGSNSTVRVAGEPFENRRFEIQDGEVRVGNALGRRLTSRDGLLSTGRDGAIVAVAPNPGGGTTTPADTGAGHPTITPVRPPTGDRPSEHTDPTTAATRDNLPAHVFGRVLYHGAEAPLDGAFVAFSPALIDPDALSAILPTDPAERFAALRDVDMFRAQTGSSVVARTGPDGGYDFPKLDAGIWRVDVLAPDRSGAADGKSRFVQVRPGGDLSLDLTLADGSFVFGRVVDSRGRAISGAQVNNGLRGAITNEAGEFYLLHVPTDGTSAVVRAEGYADTKLGLVPEAGNVVAMVRADTLRGVVRDASGSALLGHVEAGFELAGMWTVERANTDRDGYFALRTVPSDVPVRIVVTARDHASSALFLHASEGRGPLLSFALQEARNLKVFPFDVRYGRPFDSASILALAADEVVAGRRQSEGVTLDGLTDAATVHGVASGPGLRTTGFDIEPNDVAIHVDLEPARARTLRIVDGAGTPIDDALVTWRLRVRDDVRTLALVPVVVGLDGYALPDIGLDGGGMTAELIIRVGERTDIVVDDPLRDELQVVVDLNLER